MLLLTALQLNMLKRARNHHFSNTEINKREGDGMLIYIVGGSSVVLPYGGLIIRFDTSVRIRYFRTHACLYGFSRGPETFTRIQDAFCRTRPSLQDASIHQLHLTTITIPPQITIPYLKRRL